ncbi:MAG: hypothetical protein QG597_2462 [Actinomycetota bacterium]|nr:hypothetical protein [Actinomycetota bacterium]
MTTVVDSVSAPVSATWPSQAACVSSGAASLILVGVAGFQVALVLGAPWAAVTQGGTHTGALPVSGRVIAGMSAALLLVMAGAERAGIDRGPLATAPTRVIGAGLWFTTIYSGAGVVLNLASPSLPEKALWAPVTAVILGLSTVVLRSWRRRRPA